MTAGGRKCGDNGLGSKKGKNQGSLECSDKAFRAERWEAELWVRLVLEKRWAARGGSEWRYGAEIRGGGDAAGGFRDGANGREAME